MRSAYTLHNAVLSLVCNTNIAILARPGITSVRISNNMYLVHLGLYRVATSRMSATYFGDCGIGTIRYTL